MRAVRDASLFAMNIMTIARFFGLETHPMEGFNEQLLREFLNIEDYKEIPMIISIGYKDPTKNLLPRGIRFSFSDFGKII
jgi:putative NAD(P)H nitroreductase